MHEKVGILKNHPCARGYVCVLEEVSVVEK